MRTFKSLVISKSFADLVYEDYVQNTTKRKNDDASLVSGTVGNLEASLNAKNKSRVNTPLHYKTLGHTVEGKVTDNLSPDQEILSDKQSSSAVFSGLEPNHSYVPPVTSTIEKPSKECMSDRNLNTAHLSSALRFSSINLPGNKSCNFNNFQPNYLESDAPAYPISLINYLEDFQTFIQQRFRAKS